MKATMTLLLCATFLLASCTIPRRSTLTLQAEERIVTGIERPAVSSTGVAYRERIICAEPSPDALKAIAASGSLSKSEVLAISGAYQEAKANIGLRTQSIQLLRDQLYSLCQAYANGVINRDMYTMYLNRNQRNTVAILAIEQLTGVTRGSIATVAGNSSATVTAQGVQKQTKLLEAAKNQLKTLDASSAQAKELQKLVEEEQAVLDKANAAITTAVANGLVTNVSQTTQPDAASVAKIADAVQIIANSVTSANDFYYFCFDAYRNAADKMPASLKQGCDKAFINFGNATDTIEQADAGGKTDTSSFAPSKPKPASGPKEPQSIPKIRTYDGRIFEGPALRQTPPNKNDL